MCKLFIIGNGFDLAHHLPTSYGNFRNFLYRYATMNPDDEYNFTVPQVYTNQEGGFSIDESDAAVFLYNLLDNTENIGDNWQDFEGALGRLNFEAVFDDNFAEVYDHDGDLNPFHTAYNREDMSNSINESCGLISNIFTDWIHSICLDNTIPLEMLSRLFDRNSLFLTFNYTRTLEDVYQVSEENICHIHGSVGETLVVGHGLSDIEMNSLYDFYERRFIGAEDALFQTIRDLRKPVDVRLQLKQNFFDRLNNITDIYSYGFSFSDVDLPYIRRICEVVDTLNARWYQYRYNGNDYRKIIEDCGFTGQINNW